MTPSQPPTIVERPKRLPPSWLAEQARRAKREQDRLGCCTMPPPPPPREEVPS